MRDAKRLPAAENNVRNAGGRDLSRERERLLAGELIGPSPIRPRFLAAGEATARAAIGELPGDEERRAVVLGGRAEWAAQVKRM